MEKTSTAQAGAGARASHALYGSEEEAARFIGVPARRIRKLLARISTGEARP